MAKEYYKKSTGLAPTNTPKIRIYDSVDDAVNDLDNLNVGDVVASKLVEGAADIAEAQQIIADSVAELEAVIPDDAGVTNQLITSDDLAEVTDKIDTAASSTNKLLSQSSIEDLMNVFADTIEPIGTIKAVHSMAGWDSHWHICDGTNGTPDLRGYTLMGADGSSPVGSKSAGLLPEIYGTLSVSGAFFDGSFGAFTRSGSGRREGTDGNAGNSTATFRASDSNSLYGTTDKVIPANVRVYFIMKISNYAS